MEESRYQNLQLGCIMMRQEILSVLRTSPNPSVLIVGAGINGIGTFRELALSGIDVLLIDRGDFCSGASSASSRMAHGGIRYLENGEFRLVREAVQERNRMIRNSPHLVRPLPTTIPIFRYFSGFLNAPLKFLGLVDRPSERGALILKLGLILYDTFTGPSRTVPKHQFLGRNRSLERWNDLNPRVVATATYYDGAILNPERLALELMLDAQEANPNAHALNYVSMISGSGNTIVLRDELTSETYEVVPKLLINAAGPWIDLVNQTIGHSTRYIGGTKGSHLVLKHDELRRAIGDHEFFFENKDGRIVLISPLYDRVLIGTSDLPIDHPDKARCTDEEVNYFIEMVGRVFPGITINRADIVFQYSGVRPLAYNAGSKAAGQITRDHHIQVLNGDWTGLSFPVHSLVGGKWTSFRAFSEQAAEKALAFLGLPAKQDTKDLPVGGGRGYPRSPEEYQRRLESLTAWTGLAIEKVQILFERYGTRSEQVAEYMRREPDAPLHHLPFYSRREIDFIAQNEKVVHLDDLLIRRSTLAVLGELSSANVAELAEVLGNALGWDTTRQTAEKARAIAILSEQHGVRL
jgi:glycerol-3-phosphate dehydrogenase